VRRLVLVVAHVDFKFTPRSPAFPVQVIVAETIEKQSPPQIQITHQRAPEMRNMADVVSADLQRKEKLNRDGSGHEKLHRNHDGKRDQPDLAVRKQDARGDQYSVNRPGSADRGNGEGKPGPVRVENRFDEDVDKAGADASQKVILIEAVRSPGPFQIHPEKIQKQHVEQEMPDAGVQKQVGRELPDKQPACDVPGNQSEKMIEKRRVLGRKNQLYDGLNEKNARASDDDVANRRRQHPSPTDATTIRPRIS
jgi:hypothetical protein